MDSTGLFVLHISFIFAHCEMSIQQPVNQVKLTKVAVVRLRQKGKRFEVACYKNKVKSWREGLESDLDEVLQVHNVFLNVSKGVTAKKKDLQQAFGTEDIDVIVKEILERGEVQVGEKERHADLERMTKDLVSVVHDKCVNKETGAPFPALLIEEAMHDAHFTVSTTKSAKQQALALIRVLQARGLPIQRMEMRVRVTVPAKVGKRIKEAVKAMLVAVENEDWTDVMELEGRINPGTFRELDALVQKETKGEGSVEVLDTSVVELEDEDAKSVEDE